MSLAERKWLRVGTLLALYVAQGIPWGFTATTLPPYLSARGVDAAGLSNVVIATTLPYSFKWIWGPIIDTVRLPFVGTRFGRRRPWIVLAQLLMALTIGAMLLVDDLDADLTFLAQLVLVHTVFNALQDVATDGLAVDLLEPDERGRVNGLLFAAKYGGGVIGGAGLAAVIERSSLHTALLAQVGILLAIMLVPLLVAETDAPPERPLRVREVLGALAQGFATRSAFGLALIMLALTLAQGTLSVVATSLFTTQLGWTDTEYTSLTGGWGLAFGLGGSLLGGYFADRVGHRRLATYASVGLAAGWLVFGLGEPLWRYDAFAYVLAIWEQTSIAVITVSAVALCMGASNPAAGASQFAAYMALSNFSTTLGYSVPGWIPDGWSPTDFYFAGAGLQLACAVLLVVLAPRKSGAEAPPPSMLRGALALGTLAILLAGLTAFVVWRKLAG